MSSPSAAAPGWYQDGITAGVLRWYDGTTWTTLTKPDPASAATPEEPAPAQEPPATFAPVHASRMMPNLVGAPPAQRSTSPYEYTPADLNPVGAQPLPAGYTSQQQFGFGARGGYPQAPEQRSGLAASGPSDAMHWILPVGRSWQSVVAGYVGLVALAVWILGPVAIGLGVWAMVRAQHGGHGRGRAVFGIVCGLVGTVLGVAFLAGGFS